MQDAGIIDLETAAAAVTCCFGGWMARMFFELGSPGVLLVLAVLPSIRLAIRLRDEFVFKRRPNWRCVILTEALVLLLAVVGAYAHTPSGPPQ